MEARGIISQVEDCKPTEWLSNLAIAKQSDGDIRICIDPRDLNAAIRCTYMYHRSPNVEDITYQMSDAKIFSKLDARQGYWSIVLNEDSSWMTAFRSPATFQRYKFNRLPFGLSVSQDLFQAAMDKITRGQPGVIAKADGICVFGYD